MVDHDQIERMVTPDTLETIKSILNEGRGNPEGQAHDDAVRRAEDLAETDEWLELRFGLTFNDGKAER